MSVVTVPVTLNVPKETKEVIDFLAAAADLVIKKAPIADYMTLVDELYKGLDGVDKVKEEVKSEHKGEIVAYLSKTVGEKL